MEFRELGKTGEKISTIGMGTWGIGIYSSKEERDRQVSALRRGLELGMNLIDTAEMYHSGRSEEVVGDAIEGQREKAFVATKVSPEHLHHDQVISACQRSLGRLKTDHIDLYQVHWPNPNVSIRETMQAMEELVKSRKVRYVGVSNFDSRQTEEARASLSRLDLASNQVEYSLGNQEIEESLLPYCRKEKVSVIAYSPLARGRIPHFTPDFLGRHQMTSAQVALNWVTRDKTVLAIPKSSNLKHIEENAHSVDSRFSEEEYGHIGNGS